MLSRAEQRAWRALEIWPLDKQPDTLITQIPTQIPAQIPTELKAR